MIYDGCMSMSRSSDVGVAFDVAEGNAFRPTGTKTREKFSGFTACLPRVYGTGILCHYQNAAYHPSSSPSHIPPGLPPILSSIVSSRSWLVHPLPSSTSAFHPIAHSYFPSLYRALWHGVHPPPRRRRDKNNRDVPRLTGKK